VWFSACSVTYVQMRGCSGVPGLQLQFWQLGILLKGSSLQVDYLFWPPGTQFRMQHTHVGHAYMEGMPGRQ
jgi:hypothetical protein